MEVAPAGGDVARAVGVVLLVRGGTGEGGVGARSNGNSAGEGMVLLSRGSRV